MLYVGSNMCMLYTLIGVFVCYILVLTCLCCIRMLIGSFVCYILVLTRYVVAYKNICMLYVGINMLCCICL